MSLPPPLSTHSHTHKEKREEISNWVLMSCQPHRVSERVCKLYIKRLKKKKVMLHTETLTCLFIPNWMDFLGDAVFLLTVQRRAKVCVSFHHHQHVSTCLDEVYPISDCYTLLSLDTIRKCCRNRLEGVQRPAHVLSNYFFSRRKQDFAGTATNLDRTWLSVWQGPPRTSSNWAVTVCVVEQPTANVKASLLRLSAPQTLTSWPL